MRRAKTIEFAPRAAAEEPGRVVEADLRAVETKLRRLLDSNEPVIAEICHYLVDGGGKRLRPLFMLLVHRACGGDDRTIARSVDAAIALELIHSATLLHDDIVDGGLLRRGKPSAFARYGMGPSLVAGDYLFCRAFDLCAGFRESHIHTAANACIELSEGEMMEGRFRHRVANLADYLMVIERKTASLFQAGGRVAADLADAPAPIVEAMARLGKAVGLAFQMVDDLLDILGPEEKIGKPVGSDLRAGIPSLPVVLGIENSAELRQMFENGTLREGAVFERALKLLSAPELVARARALAGEQVQIARELLEQLEPSIYRDSLAVIIDEQIDREV